ncbi:hypothetical protein [Microbacterium sp. ZW T5_56]|uniref:hypothetical protein n=1 Tax=Microbacterium sp. ZW T5_56 TaxID=3378081 RepID=UPI003851A54E
MGRVGGRNVPMMIIGIVLSVAVVIVLFVIALPMWPAAGLWIGSMFQAIGDFMRGQG